MNQVKWLFLSCMLFSGVTVAAEAPGDSLILGQWQTSSAVGVKYRSIYRDKYNQLKMTECHNSFDLQGDELPIVVCHLKPEKSIFLSYNEAKDFFNFKTSGQVFNAIKSDGRSFKQTGIFGLFEETWEKSSPEVQYVYIK